jgi:hypothetical protein
MVTATNSVVATASMSACGRRRRAARSATGMDDCNLSANRQPISLCQLSRRLVRQVSAVDASTQLSLGQRGQSRISAYPAIAARRRQHVVGFCRASRQHDCNEQFPRNVSALSYRPDIQAADRAGTRDLALRLVAACVLANHSDHAVRSRNGSADRRRDHRDPARSQSDADFADGWRRHHTLFRHVASAKNRRRGSEAFSCAASPRPAPTSQCPAPTATGSGWPPPGAFSSSYYSRRGCSVRLSDLGGKRSGE